MSCSADYAPNISAFEGQKCGIIVTVGFLMAGATGVADNYGDSQEVPLFDRFFIGGSRSVRGFGNRDIGPVDNNNEPLGGDTSAFRECREFRPHDIRIDRGFRTIGAN